MSGGGDGIRGGICVSTGVRCGPSGRLRGPSITNTIRMLGSRRVEERAVKSCYACARCAKAQQRTRRSQCVWVSGCANGRPAPRRAVRLGVQ